MVEDKQLERFTELAKKYLNDYFYHLEFFGISHSEYKTVLKLIKLGHIKAAVDIILEADNDINSLEELIYCLDFADYKENQPLFITRPDSIITYSYAANQGEYDYTTKQMEPGLDRRLGKEGVQLYGQAINKEAAGNFVQFYEKYFFVKGYSFVIVKLRTSKKTVRVGVLHPQRGTLRRLKL